MKVFYLCDHVDSNSCKIELQNIDRHLGFHFCAFSFGVEVIMAFEHKMYLHVFMWHKELQ